MTRNWMMASAMMFLVAGCGSETPADGQADTIDDASKADSSAPAGNFSGKVKVGQITDLTLNSDKSYSRMFQNVDCIPGPCRAEEGTYKFSHSTSAKYIRFYDSDGNFLNRYSYKLAGSKLSLEADGSSTWFYVTKTNLGTLGDSCGGFVANVVKCADGLECDSTGKHPDLPGTCSKPVQQNACEAAGGNCVGLAPGNCDGQVGDARQFSCGGGLGVECCFPSSDPPSGAACKTAKDCSGALPDFCRVCSDGSDSCAHWSCVQKHCTIATCD